MISLFFQAVRFKYVSSCQINTNFVEILFQRIEQKETQQSRGSSLRTREEEGHCERSGVNGRVNLYLQNDGACKGRGCRGILQNMAASFMSSITWRMCLLMLESGFVLASYLFFQTICGPFKNMDFDGNKTTTQMRKK